MANHRLGEATIATSTYPLSHWQHAHVNGVSASEQLGHASGLPHLTTYPCLGLQINSIPQVTTTPPPPCPFPSPPLMIPRFPKFQAKKKKNFTNLCTK
jgi:hypothetical protein